VINCESNLNKNRKDKIKSALVKSTKKIISRKNQRDFQGKEKMIYNSKRL
jgi:hypothetical protein